MTMSRKIAAALEGLPAASLSSPTPITAEDGPHRLTLSVLRSGPVGFEADSLEFATSARPEWSLDDLKAWGDRLAARVTYLMEPLKIIEADPLGVEVELRSQAPTARHDRRSYYEVRLGRSGTLRLHRVAFHESDRRCLAVPFQMTCEVLERLADDLVASVG
ncbi:MAG: hypothetical protein IRY99_03675 [Isosphaeraceae bacterium]|nr:hypothetical protein [Isosphaeraceae bacterium]